jgi:hypothetical protein
MLGVEVEAVGPADVLEGEDEDGVTATFDSFMRL